MATMQWNDDKWALFKLQTAVNLTACVGGEGVFDDDLWEDLQEEIENRLDRFDYEEAGFSLFRLELKQLEQAFESNGCTVIECTVEGTFHTNALQDETTIGELCDQAEKALQAVVDKWGPILTPPSEWEVVKS